MTMKVLGMFLDGEVPFQFEFRSVHTTIIHRVKFVSILLLCNPRVLL